MEKLFKELGITPASHGEVFCEMLEALIDSLMKAERLNDLIGQVDPEFLKQIYKTDKRILAIQKATGKSWEDLKAIIQSTQQPEEES